MEQQIHGGNIYDKNIYNKEITLDYSVNINPLGMPQKVCNAITQDIGGYQTYPDIKYTALRNAIASKESINADNIYKVNINARNILCGNGASELIMAVVRAVHPEKCAIAAPSFSGYERAVKAYGAGIVYYELDSNNGFSYEYVSGRLEQLDVQLCFICNPNNPTGNIIPENILINILDICRRRNIIVVADECFLRFNRNYEKISCKRFLKDYNNLVIINAYTKFYAMAGIRLGYLMSYNDELIDNISLQLPEWNISTVAQRAGIAAFKDKDYEGHTYRLIEKEREFLTDKLSAMECIVYPSVADYITFRLPVDKAGCQLQDELLKNGILIRSCQSYRNMPPDCYRIAVKKHTDNEILIDFISDILIKCII